MKIRRSSHDGYMVRVLCSFVDDFSKSHHERREYAWSRLQLFPTSYHSESGRQNFSFQFNSPFRLNHFRVWDLVVIFYLVLGFPEISWFLRFSFQSEWLPLTRFVLDWHVSGPGSFVVSLILVYDTSILVLFARASVFLCLVFSNLL